MPLNYILSTKNKKLLILDNYIYHQERDGSSKVYWKCNYYKKFRCRGRVHTQYDQVVKYVDHNHAADIRKEKSVTSEKNAIKYKILFFKVPVYSNYYFLIFISC